MSVVLICRRLLSRARSPPLDDVIKYVKDSDDKLVISLL